MLQNLIADLRVFYLDNGTLGDTSSDIIQVQRTIENMGSAMCLHLNKIKTQLISKDMPSQDRILGSFPDLATEDPNRAEALGSPMSHQAGR